MSSDSHSEKVNVNMLPTTGLWYESRVENATYISIQARDSSVKDVIPYIKSFESIHIMTLKIVLSILYISGTIANALLLVYLIYFKRYKSPMFCVILSLCVADLGVCLSSLLWLSVIPIMVVPPWMCKFTLIVLLGLFTSSSYHIVVFAVLRFFQLVYPLASRVRITVRFLVKICLSIWAFNIIQVLVIINLFESVAIEYLNKNIYVCLPTRHLLLYAVYKGVTWVMLPFLTTLTFHFSKHIILKCKKHKSVVLTSSSANKQQGRKETDSQALALVLALYLISFFPLIVHCLRYSLLGMSNISVVMIIVEMIALMNSAINPWIYMFAAESVRSDIRKMFCHIDMCCYNC